MKIAWVSPSGDGWSIAYKLRQAGHRVVYCCPDQPRLAPVPGEGFLPTVTGPQWVSYAERSDLVLVDANFASRPTRRSWEPSDGVRDLQQLRHRGVRVIGPTPATELLENDPRYFRKVLKKVGLTAGEMPVSHASLEATAAVTVTRDPDGRCYLVFRHRHLLGDGNGPDLGNLGDIVVPVPASVKLVQDTIGKLDGFLDRTGFNSYLNVDVAVTEHELRVCNVQARFIYPAIFCMIADQLSALLPGNNERLNMGLATTIIRLNDEGDSVAHDLAERPGFFGRDLVRDASGGKGDTVTGTFVGAVVGQGGSWNAVKDEVDSQLRAVLRPGWGFRPNIGSNVSHVFNLLQDWKWVS